MNDSYVTLQGWVGNVEVREVGDAELVALRVASTPRYLKAGEWVDGQTSWYTVNCWRTLARNVKESVRRGDAVVVHGRVRVEAWSREGEPERTAWSVEASFLGHDLTRGTSSFVKTVRSAGEEAATTPASAASPASAAPAA